jgi:hypothetical protein
MLVGLCSCRRHRSLKGHLSTVYPHPLYTAAALTVAVQ